MSTKTWIPGFLKRLKTSATTSCQEEQITVLLQRSKGSSSRNYLEAKYQLRASIPLYWCCRQLETHFFFPLILKLFCFHWMKFWWFCFWDYLGHVNKIIILTHLNISIYGHTCGGSGVGNGFVSWARLEFELMKWDMMSIGTGKITLMVKVMMIVVMGWWQSWWWYLCWWWWRLPCCYFQLRCCSRFEGSATVIKIIIIINLV